MLTAQLSEEKAEFENHILSAPRLGSCIGAGTALIVTSEQNHRESGVARMVLKLLEDGAATIGLLMQNDDFSTSSPFEDTNHFVEDGPRVPVHYENRA